MRSASKNIQTLVSRERVCELVDCCRKISQSTIAQSPHYRFMIENPPHTTQFIPETIFVGLWNLLADHATDKSFALKLSESPSSRPRDLLYSWICQAPTIYECLKILVSNTAISNPSEQWKMKLVGDRCQLHYLVDTSLGYPYQAIEHAMFSLVSLLNHLTRSQLVVLDSSFKYPEPEYSEKYMDVLGVKPKFSMDHTYIEFARGHLDTHILNTSDYTRKVLEDHAREVRRTLTNMSLSIRVRQIIFETLEYDKVVSLDTVSSALFISKQTLARRLHAEGTTFREIVDNARKLKAMEAIRVRNSSFSEISYSLGFKDSSSFNKAFRRWFGISPSEYVVTTKELNKPLEIESNDNFLIQI